MDVEAGDDKEVVQISPKTINTNFISRESNDQYIESKESITETSPTIVTEKKKQIILDDTIIDSDDPMKLYNSFHGLQISRNSALFRNINNDTATNNSIITQISTVHRSTTSCSTISSNTIQSSDNSDSGTDFSENSDPDSTISLTTVFPMKIMTPTQQRQQDIDIIGGATSSIDNTNMPTMMTTTMASSSQIPYIDNNPSITSDITIYSSNDTNIQYHRNVRQQQHQGQQNSTNSFRRRTLLTSQTKYEIRRDDTCNNTNRYHTWYEIIVISEPQHWSVWRRYSEFATQHKKLKQFVRRNENKGINIVKQPKFPPKKVFGRQKEDFVEQRQILLRVYWDELNMYDSIISSVPFLTFIGALRSSDTFDGKIKSSTANHVLPLQSLQRICDVGDIILFKTQGLQQTLQRGIQNTNYDHVGIIVRYCEFNNLQARMYDLMEATTDGVMCYPLLERLHVWSKNGAILAYRHLQMDRTCERLEKLSQFVLENTGKPYSLTPMKFLRYSDENVSMQAYFCSELVAYALRALGAIGTSKSLSSYLPVHFSHDSYIDFIHGAYFEPVFLLEVNVPEVMYATRIQPIVRKFPLLIDNSKDALSTQFQNHVKNICKQCHGWLISSVILGTDTSAVTVGPTATTITTSAVDIDNKINAVDIDNKINAVDTDNTNNTVDMNNTINTVSINNTTNAVNVDSNTSNKILEINTDIQTKNIDTTNQSITTTTSTSSISATITTPTSTSISKSSSSSSIKPQKSYVDDNDNELLWNSQRNDKITIYKSDCISLNQKNNDKLLFNNNINSTINNNKCINEIDININSPKIQCNKSISSLDIHTTNDNTLRYRTVNSSSKTYHTIDSKITKHCVITTPSAQKKNKIKKISNDINSKVEGKEEIVNSTKDTIKNESNNNNDVRRNIAFFENLSSQTD